MTQEQVRELIREYGMTQLSRDVGVASASVAGWMRRGVPAKRAIQVADILGVTPQDLRPDVWQ